MLKNQYFWKLWDAANIITGFAATQSLAFAFLFITHPSFGRQLKSELILGGISFFIIIGGAIYSIGVSKCLKWAKSLLLSGEKMEMNNIDVETMISSINYSTKGRIWVIIFFTLLDIGVLFLTRV
ncbi:MAG: hypothetical protein PF485_13815 [Bacteroidales bacterium]|jgi:hypothetical protein|nr:hypothetical protein [Bacteroidales bacterium]